MLLVRFCCALLSALLFTFSIPRSVLFLWWNFKCREHWDETCEEAYEWLHVITLCLMLLVAILWIATWAYLEIMRHRQSTRQRPRLLTHLRYGPIAVVVFSLATLLCYDTMMIQYSRWQIVRYIHSNASPREELNLDLHNNFRGFCGNGMAAHTYALYGTTPAEYIDDPDPLVIARAVKASIYVYDWINHSSEGPSRDVIRKAMADENPLVREIAAAANLELGRARF